MKLEKQNVYSGINWMMKCTIGFSETPCTSKAASRSSRNLQDLIALMRIPSTPGYNAMKLKFNPIDTKCNVKN
jgi:hypothetical protein